MLSSWLVVAIRPGALWAICTVGKSGAYLLPMALKLGTGSEQYAPLARAIIGGLTVSVILTVFIVPAAYLIAYRGHAGFRTN